MGATAKLGSSGLLNAGSCRSKLQPDVLPRTNWKQDSSMSRIRLSPPPSAVHFPDTRTSRCQSDEGELSYLADFSG